MNGWTAESIAKIGISRAKAAEAVNLKAKAARGSFHKSGQMNKLEAAYAARLESLKLAGEIADYRFECIKLRLADKTFYTPDFMVLMPDFSFEMHEVKGFWEDDARVKIKVAAAQFPFKFVAVKKTKNGWVREVF